MPGVSKVAVSERKAALRSEMRRLRRELSDRSERSERLWGNVQTLDAVARARHVMVFTSIVGEPETAGFVEWCRDNDRLVATPEDDVDPQWPDVIIVPGLAFTAAGHRLGQGGGWYDRFLLHRRADCVTVGVCFEPQLVDTVPTEAHDVVLDHVITD